MNEKPQTAEQIEHDHTCHCGYEFEAHETGSGHCRRFMTEAPEQLQNDFWKVDEQVITGYTLREQRGYWQHLCGCWSRWPGSDNSIKA